MNNIIVNFQLVDGRNFKKNFMSIDGIIKLEKFMKKWRKNGFIIVDEGIFRYEDFYTASISKN